MTDESLTIPTAPTDAYGTPLYDASALVPGAHVVIKDETRYASGTHKEPAARAVVAQALAEGHRHIALASSGNYGRAMAIACRDGGIACTVTLPSGWSDGGAWIRSAGAQVELIDGGYEDAVDAARRLAADGAARGWVDGNVVGPYQDAVLRGHGAVVDALAAALPEPPTALWLPVGNGTTIVAAHQRIRALGWSTVINGVGSEGNNPLLTSRPGAYRTLDPAAVHVTDHNQPLVNWHAMHGPEALHAVADTGGAFYGVGDGHLRDGAEALRPFGPEPTSSGAVALAGLLRHARDAGRAGGTHVVLLSGRLLPPARPDVG